jgi:hypothetical protein
MYLFFLGATVSTRGRFMTEQEKVRCPHERPLYLYIHGHSKHNIDRRKIALILIILLLKTSLYI